MLNTKLASALVIAVSALAAGNVMAQPVFADNGAAGKTRAEVQADLAVARANGVVDALDSDSYTVFFSDTGKSSVTREQVRAELAAARANGVV
uniref:DUF4148 domain-containing protein n=1 Tax=Polaromonas sp. TaxID=1869339 RepID=UPI002FC8ACBA